MHEFTVMQKVAEAILGEARSRNGKVKEVLLEVGALTFLSPPQLEFAYEVLSKGNEMEGSRLSIVPVEPEVRCASCGYTGTMEYGDDPLFHTALPRFACPKCGGEVEVVRGQECTVKNIRMAVPEAEACSN